MQQSDNWFRLPPEFRQTGDPCDGNPFPVEDPRHRVWDEATVVAEAEIASINAKWMSELSIENVFTWKLSLIAAKFDAWARRGLSIIPLQADARSFDRFLVDYANSWLDAVDAQHSKRPPPYNPELILLDLRNLLGQRVQAWKAGARRILAERNAARSVNEPPERERSTRPSVSAGVILRRKQLVREYRSQRDLSAAGLARSACLSDTTIRGVINEDWKRISLSSQAKLLTLLGLTRAEWYQE